MTLNSRRNRIYCIIETIIFIVVHHTLKKLLEKQIGFIDLLKLQNLNHKMELTCSNSDCIRKLRGMQ